MFTIKVNLDLGELEDALERLMDAGHDMTPLTRNISEIMYDATARAFQAEQSPDSRKWAPLTPLTLSRRKGKGKILAPTGGASGLRGSIQAEHDATSARVGTNRIYAGPHQFGARKREFKGVAPWGDLPARPFLRPHWRATPVPRPQRSSGGFSPGAFSLLPGQRRRSIAFWRQCRLRAPLSMKAGGMCPA